MVRALAGACGPELVHRRGPLGSEGGLVHEGHRQVPKPLSHWLMSWKPPSGAGREPPCAAVVLQCPSPPPSSPVDQGAPSDTGEMAQGHCSITACGKEGWVGRA